MSGLHHIVPQAASQTILIVDSDPVITKLCKTILQQAGFSVLDTDGSSEALKICAQHEGPIDLLLTNLTLPAPGFQLASSSNQFPHVHGQELAIRALQTRTELRVIIMSGNIEQDLAGYGLRRGDLPYLSKPFEPQALVGLVRQTLQAPPPSIESLTAGPSKIPPPDEWVG